MNLIKLFRNIFVRQEKETASPEIEMIYPPEFFEADCELSDEELDREMEDIRNSILNAEYHQEIESQSENRYHIISGGNVLPGIQEKRSFTSDGLITQKDEYLIMTAESQLVRPEEIDGKCEECQRFTTRIYYCAICHKPFCFRDSYKYKDLIVCYKHQRELILTEDTWN